MPQEFGFSKLDSLDYIRVGGITKTIVALEIADFSELLIFTFQDTADGLSLLAINCPRSTGVVSVSLSEGIGSDRRYAEQIRELESMIGIDFNEN